MLMAGANWCHREQNGETINRFFLFPSLFHLYNYDQRYLYKFPRPGLLSEFSRL